MERLKQVGARMAKLELRKKVVRLVAVVAIFVCVVASR
jgi:hypothetical protein